MALNPPLLGDVPMGIAGEMFCCKRGGMQLDLEAPGMSKISMKGQIYLTTVRISFVPHERTSAVQAVDLPLQGISGEDFKQPIFGSNSLTGTIAPVPGRGLPAPAKFKLYFTSGGCSTFLKFFFSIMEKYKMADEAARREFLASQRAMQSFIVDLSAYVDASDPTTVFIVQPTTTAPAAPAAAVMPPMPMAGTPVAAYGGAAAVGGGGMMPLAAPGGYAAMPAHAPPATYAGHGAPSCSPASSAAAGPASCTPTYATYGGGPAAAAAASPVMPPPVSPSYVPPPAWAVPGVPGGGAVPVAAYAPMPTGGVAYATGGGGYAHAPAVGGAAPAGGYVMYAAPAPGAYAPGGGAVAGGSAPPATTSMLKAAVPRFF